ncbi:MULTISPECIES: hypothetical protein [unclassified Hoeflea]|uniref:hypothetical protein n=1 Tax=unclassified Hoeflea TaxID=2614931 RepID=UPI00398FB6C9
MIALSSGRSSLIRRALIGSVARRLLRDAGSDVLICQTTAPLIQLDAMDAVRV